MLELRPSCECCDRDLPPEDPDARICTYECTWCADCVARCLPDQRCPNCTGNLVPRPVRPATKLAADPATTHRTYQPGLHC